MSPDLREFAPAALLRNPHFMTVLPGRWPRRALLAGVPTESRLFTTEPHTQLLGYCHWQPHRTACRTVVLVHGLEGCSESHYMRGIAAKAYRAGFNVVRMNQRTCGGNRTPDADALQQRLESGLSSHRPRIGARGRTRSHLGCRLLVGRESCPKGSRGNRFVRIGVGRRDRGLPDHRSDSMRQSLGSTSELDVSPSFLDPTQKAYATEGEALSRQVGSRRT